MSQKGTGVWLPIDSVNEILKIRLRPASVWNVYLAVRLTIHRYGGKEARISVKEISTMTGYSKRTVSNAINKLCKLSYLTRTTRYRSFQLGSVPKKCKKPHVIRDEDKVADGSGRYKFASPMSIYVSNYASIQKSAFSARQLNFLALLFEDAFWSDCDLSEERVDFEFIGIPEPQTFRTLFEKIAHEGQSCLAHKYVRLVRDAFRSERVQGVDMVLE